MPEIKIINESSSIDYKELALKYLKTLNIKFDDFFITQFCETADALKLNPFLKELHAISYNTKNGPVYKYVTGYQVYIKRADRSQKLDGWEVTSTGKVPFITSTIVIYRKDWQKPFRHSVRLQECGEFYDNGVLKGSWAKMPTFMCEKVAISQGFRLCFPDELSGMPYTQDELPEAEEVKSVDKENNSEETVQTPQEMGMQKASDLTPPPAEKEPSEAEKQLKGGPSTDTEKEEIKQLLDSIYLDQTPIFTKKEKSIFCSFRKDRFTAKELIEAIKIEISRRCANEKPMEQLQ